MRIVHINLVDQYNEHWSYQDNLLPRMHKRAGHDVTLITTCKTYAENGEIVTIEPDEHVMADGVKLIRLKQIKKFSSQKLQALFTPYDVFSHLVDLKPDLIMVHGMMARNANKDILKYIKTVNPRCALVMDTHTCEINSQAHLTKNLKHKAILWLENAMRKQLYPHCKKVFGITPACGEYAVKCYNAPAEKVELLPLGYDPEVLPWERRAQAREEFREKHHLATDDIVIIHGGKIIRRRKTPETIEAVYMLDNPKVKLLVFGGMDAEMKPRVEAALAKHPDRVIYLGSLTPEEYHQAYYASDFALFPGGQSVLWQQAIGCGLPIVVGNDKQLDYLDRGGNAYFLDDTSAEGIHNALLEVLQPDRLAQMKIVAQTEGRSFFSYERIAQQVLEGEGKV